MAITPIPEVARHDVQAPELALFPVCSNDWLPNSEGHEMLGSSESSQPIMTVSQYRSTWKLRENLDVALPGILDLHGVIEISKQSRASSLETLLQEQ